MFLRAVVMSIAKCTRNVPFVLERLCDVDEAVRRAAFLYIAAINVTQLRVRQRLLTLKVCPCSLLLLVPLYSLFYPVISLPLLSVVVLTIVEISLCYGSWGCQGG